MGPGRRGRPRGEGQRKRGKGQGKGTCRVKGSGRDQARKTEFLVYATIYLINNENINL